MPRIRHALGLAAIKTGTISGTASPNRTAYCHGRAEKNFRTEPEMHCFCQLVLFERENSILMSYKLAALTSPFTDKKFNSCNLVDSFYSLLAKS